eukprot:6177425-Pleurochrysis_carterae.AAC.1
MAEKASLPQRDRGAASGADGAAEYGLRLGVGARVGLQLAVEAERARRAHAPRHDGRRVRGLGRVADPFARLRDA